MVGQGWYEDPFQVHEARWFSANKATSLVRDREVESHDEPPSETYSGTLVRVERAQLVPLAVRRLCNSHLASRAAAQGNRD